jgi:hypothetical protein
MMSDLEQLKQCKKNSLIAKVSISYEYIYHSNYEKLGTMIFFKYFFLNLVTLWPQLNGGLDLCLNGGFISTGGINFICASLHV